MNYLNDIIEKQYKLFNHGIISYDIINFLTKNKIMVYDTIKNIDFSAEYIHYELNTISWKYNDKNYRIPYFNNRVLDYIKLSANDDIYDYISCNALIIDDDIICGENIQKLCDIVILSNNTIDANPNTKYFSKLIKNIDREDVTDLHHHKSIFVKTDILENFYKKAHLYISDKIIISHNSDGCIDNKYIPFLHNIKLQISQNCLLQHEKLIALPIGIENRQWFNHDIFHTIRKKTDIPKTKNIYFNFSLNTHHSRMECYQALKDKLIWNDKREKGDYFIELKKHKYAICPRGNGMDTHRLWECFYLDVIPIMLKADCVNIDNLPILFLNNWYELDEKTLTDEFLNIKMSKIGLPFYNNIII